MPNPVSGTAVALAATQTRILELTEIPPASISGSNVFAVDLPNESYKMTLDQLVEFTGIGDYLPLAGGVMTGDITLSNTLSLNTVAENANAGNIGKNSVLIDTDLDLIKNYGFFSSGVQAPNNPTGQAIIGWVHGYSETRLVQNIFSLTTGECFFRSLTVDGWGDWQKLATETDLNGYLPLTGGTLTGDDGVLRLKHATAGSPVNLRVLNSENQLLFLIGKADETNDLIIRSFFGDTVLDAVEGGNIRALRSLVLSNGLNADIVCVNAKNSGWGTNDSTGSTGDCNLVTVSRITRTSSTTLNTPEGYTQRGILETLHHSAAEVRQNWYATQSNTQWVYTRVLYNGAWSAWQQLSIASTAGANWHKCGDTGYIDQWVNGVTVPSNQGTVVVTLPVAMTTTTYDVQCTQQNYGNTSNDDVGIVARTTTTVTLQSDNAAAIYNVKVSGF